MTAATLAPQVDVRRTTERAKTGIAWLKPGYEQLEIDNDLLAGGLVPVARKS